jgi:hypothetical protein
MLRVLTIQGTPAGTVLQKLQLVATSRLAWLSKELSLLNFRQTLFLEEL